MNVIAAVDFCVNGTLKIIPRMTIQNMIIAYFVNLMYFN